MPLGTLIPVVPLASRVNRAAGVISPVFSKSIFQTPRIILSQNIVTKNKNPPSLHWLTDQEQHSESLMPSLTFPHYLTSSIQPNGHLGGKMLSLFRKRRIGLLITALALCVSGLKTEAIIIALHNEDNSPFLSRWTSTGVYGGAPLLVFVQTYKIQMTLMQARLNQ